MLRNGHKIILSIISMSLLMLFTSMTWAQEEPSACVVTGALAYENWTKVDSGGTGSLPSGVDNQDYIRCKACHGWDHMATDGGYARRSRKETRPNAGAGDGDTTSRNISFASRPDAMATEIDNGAKAEVAMVTAADILHAGTGRSYADGTGSWTALIDPHSASNKADHSMGYTLGNQHPDFSADDMTQGQADCLAEFLNFADADPSVYFANIDTSQSPALYTIIGTADAVAGETFYGVNCSGCHGDPAGDSPIGSPEGGILAYLSSDGKFSEFSHKARWGIPDKSMTRDAMGSPTSADVSNMMLWLQELGGTGFAINPGLSGTWWDALRAGEGFVLDIGINAGTMIFFGTFYTYDNMGNQVYLIGSGEVLGGPAVTINVYSTGGAMWGDDFDTADVINTLWGTATFTFSSCGGATVTLTPTQAMIDMGYTEQTITLTRDLIEAAIQCPTPG